LLLIWIARGQCASILGLKQEPGAFSLLVSELPSEQLVRKTDRKDLFVILGDKKTGTAQTLLSIQRSPISYTRDKLTSIIRPGLFDYTILDTSPSVGELQEQALYAAHGVLIPCTVDYMASDGVYNIDLTLRRLRGDFKWGGDILGILPTFYDEVTRESKATLEDLKKQYSGLVLTPIHRATILRECAVEGKTIFEHRPSSRAAHQYLNLVNIIINKV
jgi:chromosome partitioning protein